MEIDYTDSFNRLRSDEVRRYLSNQIPKDVIGLILQYLNNDVKLYHNNTIDKSGSWLVTVIVSLDYKENKEYDEKYNKIGNLPLKNIKGDRIYVVDKIKNNTIQFVVLNTTLDFYKETNSGTVVQINKLNPELYLQELYTYFNTCVISISVSSISYQYAQKKWVSIVKRKGYMTYPSVMIINQNGYPLQFLYVRERSFNTYIGKYWEERAKDGCKVNSGSNDQYCDCEDCLNEISDEDIIDR
jgi:hypothetical protein